MSLMHERGLLQFQVGPEGRFLPGPIDNIPLGVPIRAYHQGGFEQVVVIMEYRNRRVYGRELWVDGYEGVTEGDRQLRHVRRLTAVKLG